MSNIIKIKRGAGAPSTSNTTAYELGFDTTNKILYINDNGTTITPLGNSFLGGVTTTIPVAKGGTGQTSLTGIRSSIGLGSSTGELAIAYGGTGATTAANARSNLGITPANIGAAASSHTHTAANISNWDAFLEKIFPVGAIYISTTASSPASLFSYSTTWTMITDRFLVGAGSSYSTTATGGAATVTLSESQVPYKQWYARFRALSTSTPIVYSYTNTETGAVYDSSYWDTLGYGNKNQNYYSKLAWSYGGGAAHENLPPYYAAYIYQRMV